MVEQWAMIIACKEAGHLGRRDNGYMLTALIAGGRTVGEHVSRVRFTFAWLLRGPRSTILIGVHTSYNSHRRSASDRGETCVEWSGVELRDGEGDAGGVEVGGGGRASIIIRYVLIASLTTPLITTHSPPHS